MQELAILNGAAVLEELLDCVEAATAVAKPIYSATASLDGYVTDANSPETCG